MIQTSAGISTPAKSMPPRKLLTRNSIEDRLQALEEELALLPDDTRPPTRDHAGDKDLGSVNDAPQIDLEYAAPVVLGSEHVAAGLYTGIVHQNVGATEPSAHNFIQTADVVDPADIGLMSHNICRTFQGSF